jgi:hypothetical protein
MEEPLKKRKMGSIKGWYGHAQVDYLQYNRSTVFPLCEIIASLAAYADKSSAVVREC